MKEKNNLQKEKGNKEASKQFCVVGVGASAGGLDAFNELLKTIPKDSGMAFVLVQHLDPKHQSQLPEILQRSAKIPVREIKDEMEVEPNHIYVIPSNKTLTFKDKTLVLTTRKQPHDQSPYLPID